MAINTEEKSIAQWTKFDTMRFIQRHIKEYNFPAEFRELQEEIASGLGFDAQMESCYDTFFKNFDNNILFCVYNIVSLNSDTKITCENVNRYFYEYNQTYIPLNILSAQNQKEIFRDIWKAFDGQIRPFQQAWEGKQEVIEHFCMKKTMLFWGKVSVNIVKIISLGTGILWLINKFDSKCWLIFMVIIYCFLLYVQSRLRELDRNYNVTMFARTICEINLEDEFFIDKFDSFLIEKKKQKKNKQSFKLEDVRESLDGLEKQLKEQKHRRTILLGRNKKTISIKKNLRDYIGMPVVFAIFLFIRYVPLNVLDDFPENVEDEAVQMSASDNTEVVVDSDSRLYRVAADNVKVREEPDSYSDFLKELHKGETIYISDGDRLGETDKEVWYRIELEDEISGWVNRKSLELERSDKAEIESAILKNEENVFEEDELFDGYMESVWIAPSEFLKQESTILLTLNHIEEIAGIIIYSGNYKDNDFHQYGKVTKAAISFDGGDEEMVEIDTGYNLEGYYVPISGKAKEITIRPIEIQPGLSKEADVSETICISEIIVLKKENAE